MGQSKHQYDEELSRGYSTPPDKLVCSCHFGDECIVKYIRENSEKGICHYCSQETEVMHLTQLVDFLFPKIYRYYGKIEDQCLPGANWLDKDDIEGGFPYHDCCNLLLPDDRQAFDVESLLSEVGLEIENTQLFEDIKNCFDDSTMYTLKKPMYETKDEELSYMWTRFCDIVKTKRRFTFFKMSEFSNEQNSVNGLDNILSELGKAVINEKLLTTIDCNKTIYRCRVHNVNKTYNDFKELVSPPNYLAAQNRMSPVGISMFYGSFDEITAIKEVKNQITEGMSVTVGTFSTKLPLKLIDFTKLPIELSVFGNYDYNIILFLRSFTDDISKEVNTEEKIEYIPTQIITEYFRYVFLDNLNESVVGIVYKSAANPNANCCVLFLDNDKCAEYLTLKSTKKYEQVIPVLSNL